MLSATGTAIMAIIGLIGSICFRHSKLSNGVGYLLKLFSNTAFILGVWMTALLLA